MYIYTYIHTVGASINWCQHIRHYWLHTYIHTYIHSYIHTYIQHTYIHECIHTYIHTHTHTHTHTHIHTYIQSVQASIGANTYVITGAAENKNLQDLLPGSCFSSFSFPFYFLVVSLFSFFSRFFFGLCTHALVQQPCMFV